jgi:hypothetical protein
MKSKNICFFLIIFFFLINLSYSQVVVQRVKLEPNNIRAWFQNTGIFDQNTSNSMNIAGFEWPKGSGHTAIFTSGLTIAARVNGIIKMASATYKGEYAPGYCNNGVPVTNSNFKIYKVSRGDNQYTNPDWANWGLMVPYGAPYVDVNFNGTYEPAIDTPGVRSAASTIFLCMTDGFTYTHTPGEGFGGGTSPLFAEVHMTAWAYDKISLSDMQFVKWVVINKGSVPWNGSYFSIVSDPDLGWAVDDYMGCDTLRKMGYCYNATNNDQEYGAAPPAVGIVILRGFINKSVFPNINLGLTAFSKFEGSPSVPCEFGANINGAYLFMKGFKNDSTAWLDPTQLVTPPNFYKKTKFLFAGDPETNIGWTEFKGSIPNCGLDSSGTPVIPNTAGDRRFIMSCGAENLTVVPNDTQTIIVAQMITRGNSNLNSVTKLKQLADTSYSVYSAGFNVGIKNISSQVPENYSLEQNFPNPFNPVTKIRFEIPLVNEGIKGIVSLKVFDITGREISTLVNEQLQPGVYEVEFNGSNLASGVYFYQLRAVDYMSVKKMLLIK